MRKTIVVTNITIRDVVISMGVVPGPSKKSLGAPFSIK
jgi:hypothetical protein